MDQPKHTGKPKQRFPYLLILAAVIVYAVAMYTSDDKSLESTEILLLQAIALFLGWAGSFYFGKQSAEEAAKEIIKPHARSAFRRLISLYNSLHRVGAEITKGEDGTQAEATTIATVKVIVIEQIATADDALEDWKDIVPEEVEDLKTKLSQNEGENSQ